MAVFDIVIPHTISALPWLFQNGHEHRQAACLRETYLGGRLARSAIRWNGAPADTVSRGRERPGWANNHVRNHQTDQAPGPLLAASYSAPAGRRAASGSSMQAQ